MSGAFQVDTSADRTGRQWFAVNVNTRESNVERLDQDRLPEIFQQPTSATADQTMVDLRQSRRMFRFALVAVIGLLLLETFLAWRFRQA